MTGPRIKAADDIDAIYEAIQQLRREKAEALNRVDAEEAKPGAVTVKFEDGSTLTFRNPFIG